MGKDKTPEFSDKIKNEPRDPQAFDRFKAFTRKILQVSKDDVARAEQDKADSRSTRDKPSPS